MVRIGIRVRSYDVRVRVVGVRVRIRIEGVRVRELGFGLGFRKD